MQKTSCELKLAISYILKILIENIVRNINSYQHNRFSEEYLVIYQLEEVLHHRYICENRCKGCLDYQLVNKIILNFSDEIIRINDLYKTFIEDVLKELNLSDLVHPIEIAINLVSNPEHVKKHLNNSKINVYDKYFSEISSNITSLKLAFYNHKIIELHDVILNDFKLPQKQKVSQNMVVFAEEYTTFYIDQNFIGEYIKNNSLKKQIKNIKEKAKYQFIFSPYLIEDGIKMNKVFLKEYFEHISCLTNNILSAKYKDKLSYVSEEIDSIVNRVLLWQEVTKAAESLKLYWFLYNQNAYPNFRRNEKNPFYQKINANLKAFFENIDIKSLSSRNRNEKTIEEELSSYIKFKNYSFGLEELISGYIKTNNDFDCIDKIDNLCEILDFINFETDTEEQKIKSSYQDTEHLKHAWKCKYFITNDKKLIKRGKFIYSLLNIDTEFLTISEFKEMMISQYKK